MAHRGMRFDTCPDCNKRGIYLRMSGECDVWQCRYCSFYAYADPSGKRDREDLERMKMANPRQWGPRPLIEVLAADE